MEFLKPKGMGGAAKLKQQLLTVGDAAGNLHVYDVPQNLWRPLTNERAVMSNFLEREMKVSATRVDLKVERGHSNSYWWRHHAVLHSMKPYRASVLAVTGAILSIK